MSILFLGASVYCALVSPHPHGDAFADSSTRTKDAGDVR